MRSAIKTRVPWRLFLGADGPNWNDFIIVVLHAARWIWYHWKCCRTQREDATIMHAPVTTSMFSCFGTDILLYMVRSNHHWTMSVTVEVLARAWDGTGCEFDFFLIANHRTEKQNTIIMLYLQNRIANPVILSFETNRTNLKNIPHSSEA